MIEIENDKQLQVAEDFLRFINRHNEVAHEKRVKQGLKDAIELINEKDREIRELKQQIKELDREIRVSKDLLRIAGACR